MSSMIDVSIWKQKWFCLENKQLLQIFAVAKSRFFRLTKFKRYRSKIQATPRSRTVQSCVAAAFQLN